MIVTRPWLLAVPLLAALAGSAGAQEPQSAADQALLRQHCTGDYMRLCAAFNPGTPQLEQCFQARMNELSPNCRGAIADYTRRQSSAAPAKR